MSRRSLRPSFVAVVALAAVALAGCASAPTRHSTSVVRYLYPGRPTVADTAGIPVLTLPLRVGIAFVPSGSATRRHGESYWSDDLVPETERIALMRRVTDHFRQQAMIGSVEVIPSAYLTPEGGFQNLDQLRAMFGVDVMVLLAYDQVQFTGQDASSLTYWTLLGAYVVQGEKNDTRTLMDAAVVDIASRKLLFRAPGTSVIKARATPVNADEARRDDRIRGFSLAADDLVTNLDGELARFKERVRERPEEVKVVRTAEYDRRAARTGAGSADRTLLLLIGIVALGALFAGGAHRRRPR